MKPENLYTSIVKALKTLYELNSDAKTCIAKTSKNLYELNSDFFFDKIMKNMV
jgi:hypothetical protein